MQGNTSRGRDSEVMTLRSASLSHLLYLINQTTHQSHDLKSLNLLDKDCEILDGTVKLTPEAFCILPYSIRRGNGQHLKKLKSLHLSKDKFPKLCVTQSSYQSYSLLLNCRLVFVLMGDVKHPIRIPKNSLGIVDSIFYVSA